jgi:uncharacterized membrane protein YkoI
LFFVGHDPLDDAAANIGNPYIPGKVAAWVGSYLGRQRAMRSPSQPRKRIMTLKKLVPLAIVSIIAAGATASAFADSEREGAEVNEATALARANVTLQQAIAAVEQQSGAKAVAAWVDNENGGPFIAVEFVKDNIPQKALVDLQTGQVVKVVADEQDRDHEDNHEGEQNDD